jgi:glutamate-5-semialdehyde dehydrogenase
MDLATQMLEFGRCARGAARTLAQLASAQKSAVLHAMADEIDARQSAILAANDQDLIAAKANALSDAMIDRLTLNRERLQAIAASIRDVSGLPDPIGQVIREWTQPNGLHISKVRVPIGVIGIIYESRPNVTSDSAVLCIKTGNAAILRGGSESIRSNLAIAEALQCGGAKAGLPADSVLLVPNTDRDAIRHMAQMDRYIDLIIPRGGSALIEMVVTHARMPVIKHSHGLCIAYVDRAADLDMAANIVVNAKTQRPGVCNAIETTLIHRDVARAFLEKVAPLLKAKKVELRADEAAFAQLSALNYQPLLPATPSDWSTEFLDLVMALAVVENIDAAIAHIDQYGSHHSDSIVTRDEATAEKFLREIDSATVYWNASTRFTDGGQFGFGAEIGISTDKLHARGPMALEELTTYKYIIRGTGQVRT